MCDCTGVVRFVERNNGRLNPLLNALEISVSPRRPPLTAARAAFIIEEMLLVAKVDIWIQLPGPDSISLQLADDELCCHNQHSGQLAYNVAEELRN